MDGRPTWWLDEFNECQTAVKPMDAFRIEEEKIA